jgi:ATP-dependent RNA helicase DDX35
MRYGRNDKQWCGNHRINHKALSRAVSIRKQLKKFLDRFGVKLESCEGDAKRLRRCLVSGYFKVSVSGSTRYKARTRLRK